MEHILLLGRIGAHLGAFWLLISYHPAPTDRYRPAVSALSVLLAGSSLALAFDAILLVPHDHQGLITAVAILFFAALARSNGNVARLIRVGR